MPPFPRPRRREDFRVAVICALPLEFDVAALAFDLFWDEDKGNFANGTCRTGQIGGHNAVLMILPNMGKVGAASATASLRSVYKGLRLAILTGICGGVPSPGTDQELVLGDVVISKSIVQYDLGRQYPGKFSRKDTIDERLGRPNADIRTLIAAFETHLGLTDLQRQTAQILAQIQKKAIDEGYRIQYNHPAAEDDILFEPEYLHRHRGNLDCCCSESEACETAQNSSCEELLCDVKHLVPRKRLEMQTKPQQEGDATGASEPRIFVGRVGSGDTVMKSGKHRDTLAKEHDIMAFEMEGAGVWDEIPCLVVKGVCDYADSHKNKKWQAFAAATSASAAKAILGYYGLNDKRSDIQPWFLVPYNENPDFVGRSRVLETIRQFFGHGSGQHEAPAKPRTRVALQGLGGIGKTQIALAYVYWLQSECPDISIFWVHSSNVERFREAYSLIAQECGIPGCDDANCDILALVKTWLERKDQGRWLLVIDNADDTELFFTSRKDGRLGDALGHTTEQGLGQYIPECPHGYVLVTTRNKETGSRLTRGKRPIEVGKVDESEAQELIRAKLDDDDISPEDLSLLSSRLEFLPLALAQAAAYILENSMSVIDYIQLLDESDQDLVDLLSEPFEAEGRDSHTSHAVTATWIISFEQIHEQHPFASEILSLMSCFDRQGIPRDFLSHYQQMRTSNPEKNKRKALVEALGTLKAFSFISEGSDQSLDMHRLVQMVTRKWLTNKIQMQEFAQRALEVVSAVYPFGTYENWAVCNKYLPHAHAVLENRTKESRRDQLIRASLQYNIAGYNLYCGRWSEGEWLLIQVIETRKRLLGEEHPDTLHSMGNLEATYGNQGRWKEAEELGLQMMEAKKRFLGDEHPDTLFTISNLALTYTHQGRLEEAEELGLQVMETRKRVLGQEHTDTISSISNLAKAYRYQGRWKKAEELEVQVVESRKRLLGEGHPDTVDSMSNLARTYRNQGRWIEAEELQLQAMRIRKILHGEEHPDTLISIASLAATYGIQGRWTEAEELQVQVLEASKRLLGEDHLENLNNIGNLAATYVLQGRWKDAEGLGLKVMEARKRLLGEEHPLTLHATSNLASTYRNLGRLKEAGELQVQVMEARKRRLGEDHPDTLHSMGNLAATYRVQGCLNESEELELRVLDARKKFLGEHHPETLNSMASLAHTWKDQGRLEDAIQLMRDCVQRMQRGLNSMHPDTAYSINTLTEWEKSSNIISPEE